MSDRSTRLTTKPAEPHSLRNVLLPGALEGAPLDIARAVSITAAGEREVTLIPPRGLFDQLRKDIGAALSDARPWLVLRRPGPGRASGQRLVFEPTTRKGELKAALFRGSGRCIAEGTVRRDGNRGVRFVLELHCARGLRQGKAKIRGSLSKTGRWQVELSR